jgi:hypothetical protein
LKFWNWPSPTHKPQEKRQPPQWAVDEYKRFLTKAKVEAFAGERGMLVRYGNPKPHIFRAWRA